MGQRKTKASLDKLLLCMAALKVYLMLITRVITRKKL